MLIPWCRCGVARLAGAENDREVQRSQVARRCGLPRPDELDSNRLKDPGSLSLRMRQLAAWHANLVHDLQDEGDTTLGGRLSRPDRQDHSVIATATGRAVCAMSRPPSTRETGTASGNGQPAETGVRCDDL